MLEDYKEMEQCMKGQQAITRIARRLLRRMRAVLLSEKNYVKGTNGKCTAVRIEVTDLQASTVMGKRRIIKTLDAASAL